MKKINYLIYLGIVAVFFFAFNAWSTPITYTGSLATATGGLVGTDSWGTGPSILTWTVAGDTGNLDDSGFIIWTYEYTLQVPVGSPSHGIIEVSTEAYAENFSGGELGTYSPQDQGNSNPGMPGSMYGLKFELSTTELLTESFSFTTSRAPVWGDFYAKDGAHGAIWNAGFLTADPTNDPSSGSILNHVLRPDTGFVPPDPGPSPIPEPSSLLLLGGGLAALGLIFRRKRS